MKVMEKMSHTWLAKGGRSVSKSLRLGECFCSDVFSSPNGEDSFRIMCYPRGKTQTDYIYNKMCVRIENVGTNNVELTYSLEFINLLNFAKLPYANLKSSMFDDRCRFRQVITLTPGVGYDIHTFSRIIAKEDPNFTFRDMIKVRVTIGIFKERPVVGEEARDRFVFIKVKDDSRFYAEESVLRERCPKLVPVDFSRDIELPAIEEDTFMAVLWYIYHKEVCDTEYIFCSNPRDPDSMGVKMIAAARELELHHMRRMIQAIMRYGTSIIVELRAWRWNGFRRSSAVADKIIVTKTSSTTYVNANNQG